MLTLWKKLEGSKTYLVMGALAIAGVLACFGVITWEQYAAFAGIAAPIGGITLRQGSKTDAKKARR